MPRFWLGGFAGWAGGNDENDWMLVVGWVLISRTTDCTEKLQSILLLIFQYG